MIVYILISIALLLCILHVLFNYNETARMMNKIPGPRSNFIIGNALELNNTSVEMFKVGRVWANTWKGIFRFWAFPIGAVSIYNPEDIETVMSTMKHSEKSLVYRFLKPWLLDGLLLSKGSKWQHRRKILTPAFHFNILRKFHHILEDNSRRMVENLVEHLGETVDIMPLLSEFTLSSICETAMGTQLNMEGNETGRQYKKAVYGMGKIFFERFVNVPYYFDTIFKLSSLGKIQQKLLDVIRNFTEKVIEDRKVYLDTNKIDTFDNDENDDDVIMNRKKKAAMLDLLLLAEKDGLIDREGVQEEVDTFMFEGHDTTASGLTFCLMLLANNKVIQDKIVEELNEIIGNDKRSANLDDLANMRYLECCIKESLRLYPPVHFISRALTENVKLSNYTVPKGMQCHILIYDLHRREDLFKNASEFDPERFLPENSVGRHPYSYIPFSAGPRNCIGQKFAIMEMKTCISALLREYELLPITKPSDIIIESDLILRNSGPILVKFVRRFTRTE